MSVTPVYGEITAEGDEVVKTSEYTHTHDAQRYIWIHGAFTATLNIEGSPRGQNQWDSIGKPNQTQPDLIVQPVPPDLDLRVVAKPGNFPLQSDTLTAGDGATVTFNDVLTSLPIVPGSLTVTAGGITGTDDGSGNISGTGVSGAIDYTTGALNVTYTTAPASGTARTATHRNGPAKVSIS